MLNRRLLLSATAALPLARPHLARAQSMPKITIGMSGWTGFAPLTLAEQAGLFKAAGVEVETRFVPQVQRNLALASGALNCVVTTVDTMILWASTMPLVQVLVLDKSRGGDGVAVRPNIGGWSDMKGKTFAVDGAGTTPYFVLAYMLRENGISIKDVKTATLAPQPAAQAFVAGQFDGCSTYEPYLSSIRTLPADKGRILATTTDHPCVVDTLAFTPDFIAKNEDAVRAVVKGWNAALEMIQNEPDKSFEIMGKRVNQSAEAFKASAGFIDWQDAAENKAYVAGGLQEFMAKALEVQKETGVVRGSPDLSKLLDTRFVG
ncbi:ABC transporter substrate-binding protein [Roseomonas marmotae]|uniref:ABC transporter substrate-binding protein n=1 Tax=Roseomonas marmotae TaxID=2768161 RepID=A0ABS3KG63_9PROT|nr:ABC transporter substrate-binding protein [Roseomonas marmotae]MBO1076463.1 ABC transporter substrate-binding protein [Roseomonas marmotae]QTI77935.1 ABC transporter substrate-binding protein [Roseomonas marmotae]